MLSFYLKGAAFEYRITGPAVPGFKGFMAEQTVQELIRAIRAKVDRTGGWDKPGSWAFKIGLTRAQVDQWMTRKAIPHPWKLVLKSVRFP